MHRISVLKRHNSPFFPLNRKPSQKNAIPLILSKLFSVYSTIRGTMNGILVLSPIKHSGDKLFVYHEIYNIVK